MLVLLFMLVQAQTVPANITKVPRGEDVCNETQTVTELQAGVSHEVVFFVDALRLSDPPVITANPFVPHRYQTLALWMMPPTGTALRWEYPVDDSKAPCPTGSVNAGLRAHVVTIPPVPVGSYHVMGSMLHKFPSGLLTRIPQSTTPFPVVVR